MLRDVSPIFDTPELPSLRRTKPLPKRRRTSESSYREDASSVVAPMEIPPLEATHEGSDALVSTESLLALQSYYMPILGGMQDLLKNETNNRLFGGREYTGSVFSSMRNGRGQEEDDGEGDYLDHSQQPGNTKKRKVPANLAVNGPGHESNSGGSGEDEPTDRAIPTGRPEYDYDAVGMANGQTAYSLGLMLQAKNRMSRATLAGLQHKEMLKNRKRQLAAVLGALTHGDTLALDQALSASYPFASGGLAADLHSQDLVKVRLSRRPAARLARAYKAFQTQLPPSDKSCQFPQADFTFTFHSATSDRLVATKDEVAALHARFEAELSRQAAKATEAARQTSAMLNGGTPVGKRSTKQSRTATSRANDSKVALEQSISATPPKSGKKKKRSALANASNPHHLRNYVPSRLPHSGQVNAAQALLNAQSLLSPLPLRFLSADVPPRRRRKTPTALATSLTNPSEEWMCPFCEYDLFYGDDADYQRAINNRKKVLKRRRRARERAAAAASGAALSKNPAPAPADDVEPTLEPIRVPDPVSTGGGTQTLARTKDRDDSRGRANAAHAL